MTSTATPRLRSATVRYTSLVSSTLRLSVVGVRMMLPVNESTLQNAVANITASDPR